jgi:hypothetical protein
MECVVLKLYYITSSYIMYHFISLYLMSLNFILFYVFAALTNFYDTKRLNIYIATAQLSYLLVAASHFSGPWFDHCRRHKTLTFSGNLSV